LQAQCRFGGCTISPFQNTVPVALIDSEMWSGLVRLGLLVARGRSIFTEWVSSGAVTMKITSSTSITSISGIMLISAIGAAPPLRSKLPNAIMPPRRMPLNALQ
jgi:hypothetical protein